MMDGSFTPADLNQPRATEEGKLRFLVKDIKTSDDILKKMTIRLILRTRVLIGVKRQPKCLKQRFCYGDVK